MKQGMGFRGEQQDDASIGRGGYNDGNDDGGGGANGDDDDKAY